MGRRRRRVRTRVLVAILATFVVAALGVGLWSTQALTVDTIAPTALAAEPLSPTSVTLDWKGSEQADSYIVRVGPDRTLTKDAREVKSTDTSITLEELAATTPGTDQYFRVDAVYEGEITSSRTGRFVLLPGAVEKPKVEKKSAVGAQFTWKSAPNARLYEIAVARDKEFTEGVETVRTLTADPTFTTTSLEPDTAYWMRTRAVNGDELGEFSEPVKVTTEPEETSFAIGSWNVCSESCDGYESRARQQAQFINDNELDIFGLQEAGGKRVGATTNAIFSGGSQEFQRADGGANARYIFYRPELFEQLGGGNFGVGNGRYSTWAKFKVKTSGREFFVVDVHLTSGRGSDGKRRTEMSNTLGRMAAINDTDLPTTYVGDLNSGVHRAYAAGELLRGAGFTDTIDISKSDPINAVFNSGHTFSTTPRRSGDYVDHIFVSEEFTVLQWKQLVRMNGSRYASPVLSDHNLMSAVLALDAEVRDIGEPTAVTPVAKPTPPEDESLR